MNYGYIKVSSDKQTVENNIRDGLFEVMMNADATCLMLITGICAGSAQGVFAEEKIGEFNLDQMVVTASRLEESNFEANANVNVVTRKDIEEKSFIWHHSARIVV